MKFTEATLLALLSALAVKAAPISRQAATCSASLASLQSLALTNWWSLPYLQLANISYIDEAASQIQNVVTDVTAAVAGLPNLPCQDGSILPTTWSVQWGPAYSGSNLLYVSDARNSAGQPIFVSVSIRGTDTSAGVDGLLKQIFEDFDAVDMVPWSSVVGTDFSCSSSPSDTNVPMIAQGTCDGLSTLLGLSSNGINLYGFLSSYLQQYPGTPIVVNGHSLGAAQTQVMAMWLAQTFPGVNINAAAFAPPTAGNGAFANQFSSLSNAMMWINSLDVVPRGYGDILYIKSLWGSYGGPSINFLEWTAIEAVYELVKDKGYSWPSPQTMMTGTVDPSTINSWTGQLMSQHKTGAYYNLMCSNAVASGQIANYPSPANPSGCP